jgi:hypothetical protein
MANLSAVIERLEAERERVHTKVQRIDAALAALFSVTTTGTRPHSMSAAARRRISIAQKARWAKQRTRVKVVGPTKLITRTPIKLVLEPPKRTISLASRRKMAPAQRRRWAKVKRG